jgi:hypothetical protein
MIVFPANHVWLPEGKGNNRQHAEKMGKNGWYCSSLVGIVAHLMGTTMGFTTKCCIWMYLDDTGG